MSKSDASDTQLLLLLLLLLFSLVGRDIWRINIPRDDDKGRGRMLFTIVGQCDLDEILLSRLGEECHMCSQKGVVLGRWDGVEGGIVCSFRNDDRTWFTLLAMPPCREEETQCSYQFDESLIPSFYYSNTYLYRSSVAVDPFYKDGCQRHFVGMAQVLSELRASTNRCCTESPVIVLS
eukprot:scaffold7176_cov145-Amphora_coffeaeformis.AAC.5